MMVLIIRSLISSMSFVVSAPNYFFKNRNTYFSDLFEPRKSVTDPLFY